MNANYSHLRVCDADREKALDTLNALTGRGFLTLAEFEERCTKAMSAETRGDLDALFMDIPPEALLPAHPQQPQPAQFAAPGTPPLSQPAPAYQAPSALGQRTSGLNIRIGLTIIIASIAGMVDYDPLTPIIILITVVALFVLKVGPSSWYTPSQRQLERKQATLALEMQRNESRQQRLLAEEQQRLLKQQAALQRQQLTNEVTDFTTRLAKKANRLIK